MGIGAWWHWLVVLLIVVLVFGTKKLKNIGGDVGGAVNEFKKAMNQSKEDGDSATLNTIKNEASSNLIDAEVTEVPAPKAAPRKRAPAKPKAVSSTTVKATPAKKPAVKKAVTK